jgi:ERCC4-related helicase
MTKFFFYISCLKVKTILLSNIDLLCFDECHDSVVRHQYIGIMQYLMCTTVDYIPPVNPPPIIIGLTAAVGKILLILFFPERFKKNH